ncbi:hypothetical protein ACLMJK_001364 [Lecanora helva]
MIHAPTRGPQDSTFIRLRGMEDFTEEQWKWLEDFDLTPGQPGNTADDQSFQWNDNTTANHGESTWERSLAEEAGDMASFLRKLADEIDEAKKVTIDAQSKKLKILDKITEYLQELESHLDKLRDLFKEVMPKIDPDWDLKSPALPNIVNFTEEEDGPR